MKDAKTFLQDLSANRKESFKENARVLSFEGFLDLAMEKPRLTLRSSEQYLLDMMDYYGRNDEGGFAAFDAKFGSEQERLFGQVEAQNEIYRLIKGFVQNGRANKVVTLCGPNGSAKSSIVRLLMRGLENYSKTKQGALYSFSFVFPLSNQGEEKKLGFLPGSENRERLESYALLDERSIAAKIPCELRDNPILLLPKEERAGLFETLKAKDPEFAAMPLSIYIGEGDLSPRSRAIFDALAKAYGGDMLKVYRHIQVERWEISPRYKMGAVTIEPEMHVDASLRQVAADERYHNLPPVLRSLNLYEPVGKIIDANRGILEFSDLLKRPLDAFKYLLGACETGAINLDYVKIYIDQVFFASNNDEYVEAFKRIPEFPSFQGRMEFVRVPYLLDYKIEKKIYDAQLRFKEAGIEAAPHSTEIAALWAVATRLTRPDPSPHEKDAKEIVKKLNPLEKALLYAGETPAGLAQIDAALLASAVSTMRRERTRRTDYEGSCGASPRLVKQLLLECADKSRDKTLDAAAVIEAVRALSGEAGLRSFTAAPTDGDFGDLAKIADLLETHYLDILDLEVKHSLDLVEPGRYEELFVRYVKTVSAFMKGEKTRNPHTHEYEAPSESAMRSLEEKIGLTAPDARKKFREGALSRIAAWSLDHKGREVDYRSVFGKEIEKLETDYFAGQKAAIGKNLERALSSLSGEPLEASLEEREKSAQFVEKMKTTFGYPALCLPRTLDYLLKKRYS